MKIKHLFSAMPLAGAPVMLAQHPDGLEQGRGPVAKLDPARE
jgi:hypothetical protein